MQKSESKVYSDKELEHPTTLKIYLYLKSKYPKNLGTREIQREMNFKSPSIVSWHLEKLHVGAYVEKSPNNRYKLTQREAQRQTLNIPLKVSVKLFKGLIISSILVISGFLTIIGIISFILLWFNPLLSAINGFVGLIIGAFLCYREYRKFIRKINVYKNDKP